jgi:cell cycle arrest protein BUB3
MDKEYIYPVNALAYHPVHKNAFASGGSDGFVCIWDEQQKKRLKQFPVYQTGISALAFNKSGDMLAIASSYCFEEGERDHALDQIIVKPITDADVLPKTSNKLR